MQVFVPEGHIASSPASNCSPFTQPPVRRPQAVLDGGRRGSVVVLSASLGVRQVFDEVGETTSMVGRTSLGNQNCKRMRDEAMPIRDVKLNRALDSYSKYIDEGSHWFILCMVAVRWLCLLSLADCFLSDSTVCRTSPATDADTKDDLCVKNFVLLHYLNFLNITNFLRVWKTSLLVLHTFPRLQRWFEAAELFAELCNCLLMLLWKVIRSGGAVCGAVQLSAHAPLECQTKSG